MIRDTSAQDVLITSTAKNGNLKFYLVLGFCSLFGLIYAFVHFRKIYAADLVVSAKNLRIATVQRGDLVREIVSQGRIIAANSPTIFSPEQGFVELLVNAGESVRHGQKIANIISPNLKDSLAVESSKLNRLQVELGRQKIQAKRLTLELQQTEDLAAVNLKAMEREKRRADVAIAAHLISQLDHEKSKDDLNRAQLEFKQARQNNALELESLDFDERTLTLQVESQRLLVASLQRRVDELSILSPVNGMVGNVQVQDQQAVADNQALITVVDLTAFEVEALVAEGYADEISPKMLADIQFNNKNYPAELTAVSPEVVDSQVVARLKFNGKTPRNLRQNQRVTARIYLENRRDVLLLELGAFMDGFDGSVFKKMGDKAVKTPVILGSKSLRYVEILDGLQPDDKIIISAIPFKNTAQELLITN